MKVKFVYPSFQRHAQAHPELLQWVPCNEYLGPPSLGIASLAAVTPSNWEIDFRDDRVEDVGLDDEGVDLVALSFFTPAAKRGLELADAFRARGVTVVAGGIFPSMMPNLVSKYVDAVVVGEGDGIWPQLLRDVERGELKTRYRAEEPVDLATLPLPRVDLYMEKEGRDFSPDDYPVQPSRGCPLKCSACVLPSHMGRRMRHFPVEHVVAQVEQLRKRGKLASFTEDTSFFFGAGTQRRFGELLDRLAEIGGDGAGVSYVGTSMPMVLATPGPFLDRLAAAGVQMFYLVGGFDPITQAAFTGKDKRAEQRAYDVIEKAYDHGLEPYTSFLVGNEDDDEGCFDRMLEFANRAKIRKAEFAIRTPYPGTPQWHELQAQERIIDLDWSHYNDANVVFQPKHMSPERLLEGYFHLWREFYGTRQHLENAEHVERTVQF